MNGISSRQRLLRGLRAEREDLADEAAALNTIISGPIYDAMTRDRQVQVLRQHAAMVESLRQLDDVIARHEGTAACR